MHNFDTFTGFLWAGLGAIGGAAKVFIQLLNMEKLPGLGKVLWLFLANSFVSGFSGFLGAVIMTRITSDDNLHVIAAGIAGYMGVAALDLASVWYKSKIQSIK
jgi:hypothetical protein